MIAKINELLQEVEALKAANAEELEVLRIKYLSKERSDQRLDGRFPQCGCRTEERSRHETE